MEWPLAPLHLPVGQGTCPNSKVTQDWCWKNLLEFWLQEVWPPSSPDCNPLDHNVWSVCEQDINKAPHNTVTSLVAKIMEVMANLPRDTMEKVCKRFHRKMEFVVEAGGHFFYELIKYNPLNITVSDIKAPQY
jgi:hypothetical protein